MLKWSGPWLTNPPLVGARISAFVRLSRFKFLVGGLSAGALGTALAAGHGVRISISAYAAAQFVTTSFHLMTHYSNDYFDRECDRATIRTPYSGGSGALVDGSLTPDIALRAALVCALVGTLGIVWLALAHLTGAAVCAALVGFFAWAYSAPPFRLLSTGFGELDATAVMAVFMPLCTFTAQGAHVSSGDAAVLAAAALAMFGMMLSVELPDLAADSATGKRNLVVRRGVARSHSMLAGIIAAMYGAIALAIFLGAPMSLGILELLTIPTALALVRNFNDRAIQEAPIASEVAGRGTALFFLTTTLAALSYASVLSEGR